MNELSEGGSEGVKDTENYKEIHSCTHSLTLSPSLSHTNFLSRYPSNIHTPKLSYDSPRYKLTPERATPLQKWFDEHKDHPYPTRHDKIVLCQETNLTFTQVSCRTDH